MKVLGDIFDALSKCEFTLNFTSGCDHPTRVHTPKIGASGLLTLPCSLQLSRFNLLHEGSFTFQPKSSGWPRPPGSAHKPQFGLPKHARRSQASMRHCLLPSLTAQPLDPQDFEFSSENSLRLPKCLCAELLMPDLVCQASEEPSPTIARDSP